MGEWKVYRTSDYDWYMGRSLEEAKAAAASDWGYNSVEHAEDHDMFDDPRELTDEEMDRLMYVDSFEDDSPNPSSKRTFREELARRVTAKPEPQLFACTEF